MTVDSDGVAGPRPDRGSSLEDPARLAALARTGLLDSEAEPSFDRLTRLAARVLGTPVALVSLVDDRRQFFKSCVGLPEPWTSLRETPVAHSFCQHVVTTGEPLVVEDARLDPRVRDNPAIVSLGLIAYLGVPLAVDGRVIGSFCASEGRPRAWSADDVELMRDLAESVVTEIRLRVEVGAISRQRAEAEEAGRKTLVTLSSIADAVIATDAGGAITFMNPVAEALCGWSTAEAGGRPLEAVFRIVDEKTRLPIENPAAKVRADGRAASPSNHTILIARDGSERPIDDGAAPIKGGRGEVEGVILVFRDVSGRKQAEKALGEAQLRLEHALSAGSVSTFTWEIPEDRVVGDSNMARFYSIRPESAAGGPSSDYLRAVHAEDRGPFEAELARVIASGGVLDFEYRVARPGVPTRWVVARGEVMLDQAGRPAKMSGVVVDITERKQAAEAIRAREGKLRLATDAAGLGIYEWHAEGDRVDWQNDRIYEIFGRTREEGTIGPAEFERVCHPDDLDAHHRAAALSAETGRFHHVGRIRRKDGSTRWIELTGRTEFAFDGSPAHMSGVVADVTDQKLAERQALRRSAQVQRLAEISTRLNATHDHQSLLGVITHEARDLFDVHQSIAGLSGGPGQSTASHASLAEKYDAWSDYREPFEEGGLAAHVCRSRRSLRLAHVELQGRPEWARYLAAGPSRPPLNGWLAAPLIARDGEALGIIHLSDKHEGDFTADDEAILVQLAAIAAVAIENARLYEELRDNDARKDEFLAMLAHELRNPLAAISGGALLVKTTRDPEALDAIREMIDRQARHLARLIDDLLDVSRIATGKIILRKESVDLGRIILRAVDHVRPHVAEKGHDLTISRPEGEVRLVADPTRVEQILGNLLTNAAKYTGPGGRIHLDARVAGGEITFRVRDTGVGIPAEMLTSVFGLFTQIDSSIDRSEGGLGIGLTLVRNLVEMHGGRVSAASEGRDRGSEFTVVLPLGEPEPEPARAPRVEDAPPPAPGGRILVVDDNRDTARMTGRLLAHRGYEVRTAHDGHEAVEAAFAFLPHFILLDIGLPGMNGYEVAASLRGDSRCDDSVIIAVSGYGEAKARDRARASGFHHHLTKPVDFDHLQKILDDGR